MQIFLYAGFEMSADRPKVITYYMIKCLSYMMKLYTCFHLFFCLMFLEPNQLNKRRWSMNNNCTNMNRNLSVTEEKVMQIGFLTLHVHIHAYLLTSCPPIEINWNLILQIQIILLTVTTTFCLRHQMVFYSLCSVHFENKWNTTRSFLYENVPISF